ncbi:Cell division protein FtsN [Faunimonas pinastri]|uniref:Cell division protein FtsN n=1 Tax=Faunimonas pinastri TaxID=1855383 RepID=A0A1H9CUJ6_9HYPH|nr:SPOR domain-containing protein [Faunimonas pinastri]SEQ04273.1 Cell division protein FtsN [Faunimonas pinastri]
MAEGKLNPFRGNGLAGRAASADGEPGSGHRGIASRFHRDGPARAEPQPFSPEFESDIMREMEDTLEGNAPRPVNARTGAARTAAGGHYQAARPAEYDDREPAGQEYDYGEPAVAYAHFPPEGEEVHADARYPVEQDVHGYEDDGYYDDQRYAHEYGDEAQFSPEADHYSVEMPAEESAAFHPEFQERHAARRPATGLVIAAAVVFVAVVGAAAYFLHGAKDEVASISGVPPIIKPQDGAVKVEPEKADAKADNATGQAVYDRVAGVAPPTNEKIVDNAEEPNEQAALAASSDANGGGLGGEISASNAPSGQNPDPDTIGPRKVRTVTVRPDGTIVTASAKAPAASPAPEPANATAAPAPDAAATFAQPATPDAQADAAEPAPAQPDTAQAAPDRHIARAQSEAAPAPVGNGFFVQLSSRKVEADAKSAMAMLSKRYASVLGKQHTSVARTDLGDKGTFYRVRVGPFSGRDGAVDLCEKLKAAGGSCFITR